VPGEGGASELLLAPITEAGVTPERSVAGFIKRLRRQRQALERARLMYVAATRARLELHWLGHAEADAEGMPQPRAGTLLALLWPVVGEQFVSALAGANASEPPLAPMPSLPLAPAPTPTQQPSALPPEQRLVADWQPTQLPEAVAVDRLQLSLRETGAGPEYSWVGLAARAVGTIVHAELQRLAQLAVLPTTVDTSAGSYVGWLTELGVPAVERASAADSIVAALARSLRDERGRWLLQGGAGDAYSELRLSGLHEGRIVNIIIDRLLSDESGDRWIIDYKTGSHEGGAIASFLAAEAERHRPQLQRYATLVRCFAPAAGAGRLRAALYFPLLGEFLELALEA
jgi:ATP-dependent exoDNAse (exonuclease V) beta subunit